MGEEDIGELEKLATALEKFAKEAAVFEKLAKEDAAGAFVEELFTSVVGAALGI